MNETKFPRWKFQTQLISHYAGYLSTSCIIKFHRLFTVTETNSPPCLPNVCPDPLTHAFHSHASLHGASLASVKNNSILRRKRPFIPTPLPRSDSDIEYLLKLFYIRWRDARHGIAGTNPVESMVLHYIITHPLHYCSYVYIERWGCKEWVVSGSRGVGVGCDGWLSLPRGMKIQFDVQSLNFRHAYVSKLPSIRKYRLEAWIVCTSVAPTLRLYIYTRCHCDYTTARIRVQVERYNFNKC